MKEFAAIKFEEIEPRIGLVTLNRPETLNSMNLAMLDDLMALFAELSKDDAIRVLIITGAGKGFSSGADLMDAATHQDTEYFSDAETFMRLVQERFSAIVTELRRIPQPVIAAVNGPAAGGGFGMALAADIRVAAPEAYFVASFANIGLSGGELGTSYYMPRIVGLARAADVLYTGRKLYAEEAERIGLVNRLAPREKLLEEALVYARQMTAKSVGGLKYTKRALEQNLCAPSLEAAIALENRHQSILAFSKDFFNMVKAFIGKAAK